MAGPSPRKQQFSSYFQKVFSFIRHKYITLLDVRVCVRKSVFMMMCRENEWEKVEITIATRLIYFESEEEKMEG